jgi:acetylornithine deacetylase/succinyl-diaminopimelate desuccinylase-like protein
MLPEAISGYLSARREEHLAALSELLSIPSLATDQPGAAEACRRAADWLAGRLAAAGLKADVVDAPGRPVVIASRQVNPHKPTLLIYGHYDVQPPDPLELWTSPPFQPRVRDGYLYARGACDDKGQLFAHLMAVEAWQRAGGGLPLNVKFLIEGQEEIGSPPLEGFLAARRADLAADAIVISDSEFFADGLPSITYALRGVVHVELTVKGPSQDVHSGIHGGALGNPVNVLAAMIASLHDDQGRVTIPGFYEDVLELSQQERRDWQALPFDEAGYAASLGVKALSGGESGYSVLQRRWSRPTLDCNGIVGGYYGPGAKTIIPAAASAKVSMRLVPNQDPDRIVEGLASYIRQHAQPGTVAELSVQSKSRPVLLNRYGVAVEAACAALEEAFGRRPAMIRCGASVPVTEVLQRLLGLDAVLMGFALPDDNPHAPNERFRLDQLWRGALASAALMNNLAAGWGGKPVGRSP